MDLGRPGARLRACSWQKLPRRSGPRPTSAVRVGGSPAFRPLARQLAVLGGRPSVRPARQRARVGRVDQTRFQSEARCGTRVASSSRPCLRAPRLGCCGPRVAGARRTTFSRWGLAPAASCARASPGPGSCCRGRSAGASPPRRPDRDLAPVIVIALIVRPHAAATARIPRAIAGPQARPARRPFVRRDHRQTTGAASGRYIRCSNAGSWMGKIGAGREHRQEPSPT